MTKQEFYIWLLNCNPGTFTLPEINPEFLKNYEIAKLVLEKFGIHNLYKNEQRYLNLKAVSNWLRVSKFIRLKYDISEILELLPERIRGSLTLQGSEFQSLPELKYVGSWLDLQDSQIESLPKLEFVGSDFYLKNSKIKSLPKLEYVKHDIVVNKHEVDYWKKYFYNTKRPTLAEKVLLG